MAGRLYPPILDYSMPAFALEGEDPVVRIYFAIPVYNSINEIESVQMTVRYLESNENALSSGYRAKIKVASIETDIDRVSRQDSHYVELKSSDLARGFETGTIYKIQLRASKIGVDASTAGPPASWFNDHLTSFSEWSTVTLIRPITAPTYEVLGLEDSDAGIVVNYSSVDSVFTVTYTQGNNSEPLKSWRARLYNIDKSTLYADSGEVIYNNYNYLPIDETGSIAFDAILPYQMTSGLQYLLKLDLTTRNGYTTGSEYPFTCFPASGTDFLGTISLTIDENEAYAKINVSYANPISDNLIIRRTSSESSFTIWEDLAIKTFTYEAVDWTFCDFTVESGVWYKYGVQTQDIHGHRGSLTTVTDIKMGEWEDAFLLEEGGRQLKLRYDFNISTSNITVAENKTDTIGSQYPFVKRNGSMYYRTFQCSGLITGYMDQDANLFTTPAELYHGEDARYKRVRSAVDLMTNSYDYTYEREFREKVQEFLYDDKVKLFKSLTEGNILVKLMNISLTPKNELGRLLYSFSAQAIEIGEPTLSNFNAYGLQIIGEASSSITFSETKLGQISSYKNSEEANIYPGGVNILQTISKKYGWTYDSNGASTGKEPINNILVNDFQLNYLRIEFESDPYLIQRTGTTLKPFTDTVTDNKDLLLGWLLSVNDETVLIQPPNNIYELKEDNLIISSTSRITPLADCQMSIYYTIQLDEELDVSIVPVSTSYYRKNGQLYRVFQPNQAAENIIDLLREKYSYTFADGTTSYGFDALFDADIEAEPGTIVYARSSAMQDETKFIINETGNLFLDPGVNGVVIDTLHFEGQQIDIRYLDPLYYWDSTYHYNETDILTHFNNKHNKGNSKPNSAKNYDYYSNNGQLYMFYNRSWYPCEQINDYIYEITCPVTAIVNYTMQQSKGVYSRS